MEPEMSVATIADPLSELDLSQFQEWEAFAKERKIDVESGQLVLFALSPVQEFIAASRSLRDLWASSLIVSKLVDAVVAHICRPNCFLIFPQRANQHESSANDRPDIASTPHRILAVVPGDFDLEELRQTIQSTWHGWAEKVHAVIDGFIGTSYPEWDVNWRSQVESFWEVRAVAIPMSTDKISDDNIARLMGGMFFSDRFTELQLLRHALRHLKQDCWTSVGRWQALTLLANRMLSMSHSVRSPQRFQKVVEPTIGAKTPTKCQMFGTFEVIGPADHMKSGSYWAELSEKLGHRLKAGQKYSAIGMIKRLLPKEAGWRMPRFDDSAKQAASLWLNLANPSAPGQTIADSLSEIDADWDGRWLHVPQWRKSEGAEPKHFQSFRKVVDEGISEYSAPPTYYAVLIIDGDNCHRRLAGKSLPTLYDQEAFREFLVDEEAHPWLASVWPSVLACRRPLTPAYHIEISEKQSRFGVDVIPSVITTHKGQLIYSGGDECLALLPVEEVFEAALAIRKAYSQDDYFGRQGSLSAGIAVAHYKSDLRAVLDDARTAIERAKHRGKDLCEVIRTMGSGECTTAALPWSFASNFSSLVAAFRKQDSQSKASDRWLRNLEQQWPTLRVFESETQEIHPAIISQVARSLSRADEATCKTMLNSFDIGLDAYHSTSLAASQLIIGLMKRYCRELLPRLPQSSESPDIRAAGEFLALCRLAVHFGTDKGERE